MGCDCGKTVTTDVSSTGVVQKPVGTRSQDAFAALNRAAELLGRPSGGSTTTELIDALCDALTICREEEKALKEELDTLAADLESCKDELDEVTSDVDEDEDDTNEGSDNSDGQNLQTTTNVHPQTLSQALQRKASREELLRQDHTVQQHGRGLQRELPVGSYSRVLTAGPVLRNGSSGSSDNLSGQGREPRDPAGPGRRELPVLRKPAESQPDVERHPRDLLAGPRHGDADVRGHLFQSRPPRANQSRVRSGRDAPVDAGFHGKLRVPMERQHSQEVADAAAGDASPGVRKF